MDKLIDYRNTKNLNAKIRISGSKSISNRLLILKQFFPEIHIQNLSDSDDTQVLQKALTSHSNTINVGHAGTAMRFLTAYYAVQEGKEIVLSGSKRMHQRPIKVLVEALQSLGAKIEYLGQKDYPPLRIQGEKLLKNKVSLPGDVSSQYVSALLLVAASLDNGLHIQLTGDITSEPYIQMSISLLKTLGVKVSFEKNNIRVFSKKETTNTRFYVEPDWSSASYYYSLAALVPDSKIELPGFLKNSIQGDRALAGIYKNLGVQTEYTESGIRIQSHGLNEIPVLKLNLQKTPDIAQTLAVTCLGLKVDCQLTGLHTLKIKETNRLQALKNELEKLGAQVVIDIDSLTLKTKEIDLKRMDKPVYIQTYEDHRMAMAFAPLAVKVPLKIEDFSVVSKSYVHFWDDFTSVFNK